MPSTADLLQARYAAFTVRALAFVRTLPNDSASKSTATQLARAATGVSGNYCSARRARSRGEFISRLAIAVEESDEACHWLEVIRDTRIATGADLVWLLKESAEIRAILGASLRTAKRNQAAARRRGGRKSSNQS